MMGSSSLCEFDYFGLGVSDILLLMLRLAFSLIRKDIGVCVDSFQGLSCFSIVTSKIYVNIA